jgi:hypothetical protein
LITQAPDTLPGTLSTSSHLDQSIVSDFMVCLATH